MRYNIFYKMCFLLFFQIHVAFSQCANPTNIYTYTYGGHSYEIVKELKNWTSAVSCAIERGGYLIEVEDQAEQNELFNQLMNNSGIAWPSTISWFAWIGGSDSGTEGVWLWDGNNDGAGAQFWQGDFNGSPVGGLYNNWGDEPDDAGGQDHLAIALNDWPFGVAGEWNDIGNASTYYFIIEISSSCNHTYDSIQPVHCNSFTSPSGVVYNTSGLYSDTISNTDGCDSIISIDLTINTSSNFNISDTVCEQEYISPSGKTWSTNGMYLDTILNVNGCDSFLDISLFFNSTNTNVMENVNVLEAESSLGEFQWLDCANGNIAISGANQQMYHATQNGEYAVEINLNGCLDTSDCFIINGIGIDELQTEIGLIQISSEVISIYFGNSNQNGLSIYDTQGRLIRKLDHITDQNIQITHRWKPGIYIVNIKTDREIKAAKILVK